MHCVLLTAMLRHAHEYRVLLL